MSRCSNGSQNISDSFDDFRYLRGVGLHTDGKLENDLLLVSSITADIRGDMVTAARLITEEAYSECPAAFNFRRFDGGIMEKIKYSEKLKDPRWQKKRLEILERDHWACASCGSKDETLHVHHLFYFYGKEPWDIQSGFLITLCETCHNTARPCFTEYKTCEECPEYGHGDSDCHGSGDIPGEITNTIATILNTIWANRPFYGSDGLVALCNAHYILKPE